MHRSYLALFLILSLCFHESLSLNLKHAPTQKSLELYQKSLVSQSLGSKLLVGYWHNFDNGIGVLPLSQVSDDWDVINVSFGETGADEAIVNFVPCYGSPAAFRAEIQGLQAKGKRVLLSLGGQNGIVTLKTDTARENFLTSIYNLVGQYGFDGIDVDLEHGMGLDAGDSDFKNPKTSHHKNLISAINTIKAKYGVDFIISMAPEIAYVQGGMSAYAGVWGGYLPVIYGVRDSLTFIHVQHYNAGGASGKDGNYYTQGTADFEVAMADALLSGFPIANNNNNMFPALRQDQVMIGLPANSQAAPAGGYIKPTEMLKALNYLTKGVSFGGKYVLANASGYPNFRGLMTWSINWDKYNNFEFSSTYRGFFGASTSTQSPLNTATASATTTTTATPTTNSASTTSTTTTVIPATTSTTTTTPTIVTSTDALRPIDCSKVGASTSTNTTASTTQTTTPTTHTTTPTTQTITPTTQTTTPTTQTTTPNTQTTTTPTTQTTTPTTQTTTPTTQTTTTTVLQAAQLTASSVDSNGSFTLTAVVPAGSKATGYTWYESGVEVTNNACTATSSPVTLKVTGKAAGTYTYKIALTDGTNTASSSVTVTVAASPNSPIVPTTTATTTPTTTTTTPTTTSTTTTSSSSVAEWVLGKAYKAGDKVSYNGATYVCLNPHTSIATWTPLVASLWKSA